MSNDAYKAGVKAGKEAAFDGRSPSIMVHAALDAYEKVLDDTGRPPPPPPPPSPHSRGSRLKNWMKEK